MTEAVAPKTIADVEFRVLEYGEAPLLQRVADGLFDHPVDHPGAEEFLADPHLHIAVAIRDDRIVGFASGVDYIHPDKPRELWINEVAVARESRNNGIGRGVVEAILSKARQLGCRDAWVLTDADNAAATALYESAGGQEERPGQRMYVFALDSE